MKFPKDVSLTIRLSQPLKDALESAADAESRSLSSLVGFALEKYLETRDEWPPRNARATKARVAARRK